MRIKKLRKKLKNKKWIANKIDRLVRDSEYWHSFQQTECSTFFRGSIASEANRKKYDIAMEKIERQLNFLESL